MQPYTPEEIDEALAEFPEWLSTDFAIHRSYSFPSFRAAIAFVNAVADLAEQHNHHPDIEIHFRDVSLSLWTHTVSGVTSRDIELAKAIETI
ncbi:4a-hydroxytetrahydrobiopterin dehydratase [bacterium]|nr:MAG: 4a-hydroxytetrahydrobiopterin dehydratase [bacterium]